MKKIIFLAALAVAVSACTNDQKSEEPQQGGRLPINIATTVSRVTDLNFESGDAVGVYVVNYNGSSAGTLTATGNHVDNMRFTYSSKWTPDQEIYWLDNSTKADFYCFYPYATVTNVNEHSFSTNSNQSTLENYKASEFLWGKATAVSPTAYAVPITTTHLLSNMLIYVKPGNGFTEESLAAATKLVKINNVKTDATVNLATGVAAASGSAKTVVPYDEGAYYRALIVPQTVAEGTNLITISVDGVDYTFAKGFTFEANKQHKFTVTVNKSNSGVNIGVGNWEIDDTDHGGSAE